MTGTPHVVSQVAAWIALIYGYREREGRQKKQRYLSYDDSGRYDHELKLTLMQEARVFFYRNVRQ
jgi:hypothetical protein